MPSFSLFSRFFATFFYFLFLLFSLLFFLTSFSLFLLFNCRDPNTSIFWEPVNTKIYSDYR